MSDPKYSSKTASDYISTGASAAKVLAGACNLGLEKTSSLQLEVVRDLARDLERQLDGLALAAEKSETPNLLAEAAQKCADLATLAACNAGELDSPRGAAEAVRLCSEATESLSRSLADSEQPDLVQRDARSASWKASLAARQMEEAKG